MQCHRAIAAAAVACISMVAVEVSAQEAVSLASATNRESWRGETAGSLTGFSLDRGALNQGDTRRDLIAGAPGWGSNTGRVYVEFAGSARNGDFSLSQADVILTGASAGDRFGEATAAGYITSRELNNPSAIRDLAVGAPGVNGNAGAVYVFLRGLPSRGRLTTSNAMMTISGAPAGARLGASLATGDLDGDGFREIIIGAPGIGAVYVVRGIPNEARDTTVHVTVNLAVPSAAFFVIQGSAADGVGQTLAAGDFAGHAITEDNTIYDLAIGATNENSAAGAVYVIKGRLPSAPFPATLKLPNDADARYGGIDAGDLAGKSLQIAYLDKGNLAAELIVGAPRAAGPGNSRPQAGEIYIIWGSAVFTSHSLASADVTIYGANAGDLEGSAIPFGDVTRDGTSDIVSLAAGISQLHLFLGRARAAWGSIYDLAVSAPDRRLIGDPGSGPIQSTTMFDFTGEGFDDIAAGYPGDGEGLVSVSYSRGPAVAVAPLPRTINPNVLTTFIASGTGAPAPTVQWQVSANGGSTWTNIPGATATSLTFLAQASDNGKRYRAVFTNTCFTATTASAFLGVRPIAVPVRRADFDGDGSSDVVVWRPSNGTWFSLTSGSAFSAGVSAQWGNSSLGDKPFMGDMDGDGIVDPIVWRPADGTWYWLTSGTGYNPANAVGKQWGNQTQGDVPLVGDMDGDGKSDLVIWRANTGTWFWLTSSSGYSYASAHGIQWGNPGLGDRPILGDFDGDEREDLGVWRASTGTWFWLTSSTNYSYAAARGIQWGNSGLGDMTFTGDTDGDGKSDLIVWRPTSGTWFWLTSSTGYSYATAGVKQWGNQGAGDVPMIGDFDGDGKADFAVWRAPSGTWFWLTSSSGYNYAAAGVRQWGTSSDIPMVR